MHAGRRFPNPNAHRQETEAESKADLPEQQNTRLDDELIDTFPASEPLPWRHGEQRRIADLD